MKAVVLKTLVVLLSLLVSLPPGWCCYAIAADCCPSKVADEKHPDTNAGCCRESQRGHDAAPIKERAPRSPSPVKPCCEASIATAAVKYRSDIDPAHFASCFPSGPVEIFVSDAALERCKRLLCPLSPIASSPVCLVVLSRSAPLSDRRCRKPNKTNYVLSIRFHTGDDPMRMTLIALFVVGAAVLGGGLAWSQAHPAKTDCCYPGSPCCFPGSDCCVASDCCDEGKACCNPPSACCDDTKADCCVEVKSCCESASPCCAAPKAPTSVK